MMESPHSSTGVRQAVKCALGTRALSLLQYFYYYETIIELYLLLLLQVNVMREFNKSIDHSGDHDVVSLSEH